MHTRSSLLIAAVLSLLTLSVASCEFQKMADAKFGDQHFKTAVALVELYRVRHGSYPESLDDLDFTGEWDKLALGSVAYEKDGEGYQLDLTRGWAGTPKLHYPPTFWQGLGITKSNVK